MGLDFTRIKDHSGSAIFLLHDGSSRDETIMTKLAEDVKSRTKKQVIVLASTSHEGQEIVRFYSLRGRRFALIVRDDDQLHHAWADQEVYDTSAIAYTAEQAG